MKIFIQISIICLFSLLGELISLGLKTFVPFIYIPGSLIGMILLFLVLYFKYLKLEDIETVGNFLIQNMGFFFIPLAVSVMDYFDILKNNLGKILFVTTFSFFITFISIALSVSFTLYLCEKYKEKKNERISN